MVRKFRFPIIHCEKLLPDLTASGSRSIFHLKALRCDTRGEFQHIVTLLKVKFYCIYVTIVCYIK